MQRHCANGTLSFCTRHQDKDICLYKTDIKETFEYETEEIDGQIIDTIVLNDEYDTVLYFISDNNHLITLQNVVNGGQEATYPVIIFDEKKCIPAIQEDTFILITSSQNPLADYPLIKKCTKPMDWPFLNRMNTCEIHTHSDFKQTEYHNYRLSKDDNQPNYYHFNTDFNTIYANFSTDEGRITTQVYNIGQKNEYSLIRFDDTGENLIYYTNPLQRLKYHFMRPKTILTLGALALIGTLGAKCSTQNHTEQSQVIVPAERVHQHPEQQKTR